MVTEFKFLNSNPAIGNFSSKAGSRTSTVKAEAEVWACGFGGLRLVRTGRGGSRMGTASLNAFSISVLLLLAHCMLVSAVQQASGTGFQDGASR